MPNQAVERVKCESHENQVCRGCARKGAYAIAHENPASKKMNSRCDPFPLCTRFHQGDGPMDDGVHISFERQVPEFIHLHRCVTQQQPPPRCEDHHQVRLKIAKTA